MDYSFDFFEFVEESNKAETVEALYRCFEKVIAQLGLDKALYNLMTDQYSVGATAGHAIVRSYPEDWMRNVFAQEYETFDPARKYISSWQDGPYLWDQLENERRLSAIEKRILDDARDAGLHEGIAVALFNPGGGVAGMGFASSDGGIKVNKNLLSLLYAIANQFDLVYKALMTRDQADASRAVGLTPREREVLNWVAIGKSKWDIAQILRISEHGVDYHLRNIYKKLNVSTRVSAVAKAIRMGLIMPA